VAEDAADDRQLLVDGPGRQLGLVVLVAESGQVIAEVRERADPDVDQPHRAERGEDAPVER